jgi:NADH:ubiquinone oxidoreductase subunit 6 (subunit J)
MSEMFTPTAIYHGIFWFLAVVTVFSAGVVSISRDLARAIFMLLFALGGIAGFYAWMGADFLFAVQLLIYVGGILVILIFAMMVSQQFPIEEEEPNLNKDISGFVVSAVIFGSLAAVAFGTTWPSVSLAEFEPSTGMLGEPLLTTYLLPFEVAGVILLMALIGATMLTRSDTEDDHSTGHDSVK